MEVSRLVAPRRVDLRVLAELRLARASCSAFGTPFLNVVRVVRGEELLDVRAEGVPGRIADHRVEAAPLDHHLGELERPVEEAPLASRRVERLELQPEALRDRRRQ